MVYGCVCVCSFSIHVPTYVHVLLDAIKFTHLDFGSVLSMVAYLTLNTGVVLHAESFVFQNWNP